MTAPRLPFVFSWSDAGPRGDMRDDVERWVHAYAWLVPTWCHEIYAHTRAEPSASDASAPCAVKTNVPYRCVNLYVFPRYLELSDGEREESVAHELAHVVAAPFHDVTFEIIRELPDVLRAYAERHAVDAMEAHTVDLTRAAVSRERARRAIVAEYEHTRRAETGLEDGGSHGGTR